MDLPSYVVYPLHRGRQIANALLAGLRLGTLLLRCRLSCRRMVVITLIEHMGDIVACEPVSRLVRAQEPDAFVVWCVKRQYRELLYAIPSVDATLVVCCLTTWIWLRKTGLFDRVIDLHISGRTCHICRIPLQKEEGDRAITLENYLNFGTLLACFCRSAGIEAPLEGPRLSLPSSYVARVDALAPDGPYLVIHCSSNERSKNWTPNGWNRLVEALIYHHGFAVVEVGLFSELQRPDTKQYQNHCGKLSLLETAEMIRRARLFVGVDSGPAHLANAVGTYGVVLMGSYRTFTSYTPFTGGFGDGTNATLITAPRSVVDLPVEEVIRIAVSAYLRGLQPSGACHE